MVTYSSVSDSLPNTLWYSKLFPIWNFKQLICKYLTRAWYKNKPCSSQQTPRGPGWCSFNPTDDSEPNWPISPAQELWPAIQGSSEPFVYMPIHCPVTHTLSLNFWPCCVCHPLTKRCPLSSVTTVDVVSHWVYMSCLYCLVGVISLWPTHLMM